MDNQNVRDKGSVCILIANDQEDYLFKSAHLEITEKALWQGLEQREFHLIYQLIYDLLSKNPIGVEAFLCWRHPTLGVLLPVQFISLAEDAGLIYQIDKWVFEQACQQFLIWNKTATQPLRFAINFSSGQLQEKSIVVAMQHILSTLAFTPTQLELGLSEGTTYAIFLKRSKHR